MAKKILIVEDHQGLRTMGATMFRNAGYEVTEAADGQQGLSYAIEGGYDVILLDLKMPMMDGLTFLNALRETPPKHENGPIIVYSNFIYGYAQDEVLRRGASAFIPKDTLSSHELIAKVEEIIAQEKKK